MDRTNWGVLLGAVAAFTAGLIGGCAPTAPLDEVAEVEDALSICGNRACETGESCASCPGDCGRCTGDHCGNGVCGRKETCVTCERDCGACSGCGNGVCEGSETCANCPLDCSKCQGEFCGNGVCGRRESCTACSRDCCPAPQCTAAADCPATGNECTSRTCVAGACGTTFVPEGNPTSTQEPGDCQLTVCDGAGGTIEVAGDDPPPDDGNPCTDSACTNGVPLQALTPAGTSCGGSNFCDGNGSCVQCTTSSSCPQPMNECTTAVCDLGVCGTGFSPQGTPTTTQTAGDCQSNACDGMGGLQSVPNDLDVADDGNPCTIDACVMGTPTHLPGPDGTPCGMGLFCIMGACMPLG